MASQFPPSSPLRDSDFKVKSYESYDPFAKHSPKYTKNHSIEFYPTPHPSSTIGRSSPHASDDEGDLHSARPPKVQFHVDKPSLPISSHLKILKVPLNKPIITLGRSSKNNDICIKSNDKTISRNHIKIESMAESLTIGCLGQNGFGITIPRPCEVQKLSDQHFKLTEIPNFSSVKQISETIKISPKHTEFLVYHGEKLVLPRYSNVIIQIKNNLIIVNPRDEDDFTEDEMPILRNTPVKRVEFKPDTPVKTNFKITSEESTPVRMPLADKTNHPSTNPLTKPSSAIRPSTNHLPANHSFSHPPPPTNAPTNQPPAKKRKSRTSTPVPEPKIESPEPEPVDLEAIENLQDINNVLINHLAFSRLSSTPLSVLRTISSAINDLSNNQLFAILDLLKPVGAIDREGKDAAGKPLEREFYYLPEQDNDGERRQLVSSIKGHGGLRSCRRTHKQYYWKKPAAKKSSQKKN